MLRLSVIWLRTSFLLLSVTVIYNAALDMPPPTLNVTAGRQYYEIRVGESFSVTCTGDAEVTWTHLMGTVHWDTDGTILRNSDPSKYTSMFVLDDAKYWETGRIKCDYKDRALRNAFSYAWVYLYVFDEKHLIANWTDEPFPTIDFDNNRGIIPCRPTAHNVTVQLLVSGDLPEMPVADAEFDPMVGFSIKSPSSPAEVAIYKCRATLGSLVDEMGIVVKYWMTEPFPTPQIERAPGQGIWNVVGGDMHLKCLVTADTSAHAVFRWTAPASVTAESDNRWSEVPGVNKTEQFSILTIRRLRLSDAGVYTCGIVGENGPDANYTVTVHDGSPLIETLTTDIWNISLRSGAPYAQWVIDVKAYPPPLEMTLTRSPGVISPSDPIHKRDYTIEGDPMLEGTVVVKLLQVTLEDFGNYSFNVKAGDLIESIKLRIEVIENPHIERITRDGEQDDAHSGFVAEGSKVTLECVATGFPAPAIHWGFERCTPALEDQCDGNYEVVGGNRTPNKERVSLTHDGEYRVVSTVKATAYESGHYVCAADNVNDSYQEFADFFITDVGSSEGFGVSRLTRRGPNHPWIWTPVSGRIDAVEGDNATLRCGASRFNHTSSVAWSYKSPSGEYSPGVPDGWLEVQADTDLSWGKRVSATSLTVSQTGQYNCAATNAVSKERNTITFFLEVSAIMGPKFLPGTNMRLASANEKPIVIENGKALMLDCSVEGVPPPEVVWFKDGKEFNPQSEDGRVIILNSTTVAFQPAIADVDDGKYECRASNRGGVESIVVELLVTAKRSFGGLGDMGFVGVLIALIVAVILLIACGVYARKMKRGKEKLSKLLTEKEEKLFREGNQAQLNPDLPVSDQVEFLPFFGERWEFPVSRLQLGQQIGRGAYGCVVKGTCRGLFEQNDVIAVAVKKLLPNAEKCHYQALMKEIKILSHLGRNLNVVNLLGACTVNMRKGELLMIVEYCQYGSLDHYLRKHRKNFQDQFTSVTGLPVGDDLGQSVSTLSQGSGGTGATRPIGYVTVGTVGFDPSGSAPSEVGVNFRRMTNTSTVSGPSRTAATTMTDLDTDGVGRGAALWAEVYEGDDTANGTGQRTNNNAKLLGTQDLLSWAYQIASGMDYLARRKVVHRDLAARNVLLANNGVVKICDFGLARDVYKGIYRKQTEDPIPYKWMPLESLLGEHESTSATDVWAYGVTMWELFSMARQPYANMNSTQVINFLRVGNRLERPRYADDRVYNLMLRCWDIMPENRITFLELVRAFAPLVDPQTMNQLALMSEKFERKNGELFAEVGDFLGGLGIGPNAPTLTGGKNLPEDANGYLIPTASVRSSGYVSMGGPRGDAVRFSRDSTVPPAFYENMHLQRNSSAIPDEPTNAVTNPSYVNQQPVKPLMGQKYVNQLEFQGAPFGAQSRESMDMDMDAEYGDGDGYEESKPGIGGREGDPLLLKNNPGYARTSLNGGKREETTDL